MRIVPAFDVAGDGEPGLDVRGKAVLGEQPDFQRRGETLRHGVGVCIPTGSHRGPDAERLTALPEGQRRVLTPLVRVVDHRLRAPHRRGHLQRVQRWDGVREPDAPEGEAQRRRDISGWVMPRGNGAGVTGALFAPLLRLGAGAAGWTVPKLCQESRLNTAVGQGKAARPNR